MADTTVNNAASTPMRVRGRVYVRAGGQMLAMASDVESTIKYGGVKREPVVLVDKTVRSREQLMPGSVETTIIMLPGMTMKQINDMENVTVTVEGDDGYTATLANAFSEGDVAANQKGEIKVVFYGGTVDETNGAAK
jgi:hypothetical protein